MVFLLSAFRILPYCLLPTAYCLLPTAFCLLPSAFCSLQLDIDNFSRFQGSYKPHVLIVIVVRIFRFNNQKETVARGQSKIRSVENRMIGLRQLVQRQHAQHGRESCHQNRTFESDWNKRRPAVERFAADVDRIINHFHPVLHEEPTHGADNSSNQHDDRQSRAAKSDRFSQLFDRKRRIAVNLSITGFIRLACGRDELARTIELGHDAVKIRGGLFLHNRTYKTYSTYASSTSAS